MSRYILFLLILSGLSGFSQNVAPNKYFIQFTDKNNSPYSLSRPEEFLTPRALQRRKRQHISLKENDLPVNSAYLNAVSSKGVKLLNASRWLNGVTVYTTDTSLIDSVEALPFVKKTVFFKSGKSIEKLYFKNETFGPVHEGFKEVVATEKDYGKALTQIKQLNGIFLHEAGYTGKGIVIAVLDAGFLNVPNQVVFDSLRKRGGILGTKDFVIPGGSVYTSSSHGRMVLSCMAANKSGLMIGTAPDASFWLLKTEDVNSENVIEGYNWVSGAEYADSVGADVINSSLGYTTFDDPKFSYTHAELNGRTAISTIGAEIAASKGILVVNSAGNSGNDTKFPWVGAPADGDSVLTVGAVTATGVRASFSSIGPTGDGRIKPTVMAMGQGTTVANATTGVISGNGTSFSSPVLAGIAACLWQANPGAENMQVLTAVKNSGSMASTPNNKMGWGIPDMKKADSLLSVATGVRKNDSHILNIKVYPNPFSNNFTFDYPGVNSTGDLMIELYDMQGKICYKKVVKGERLRPVHVNNLQELPEGIYLLNLRKGNWHTSLKVIKRQIIF